MQTCRAFNRATRVKSLWVCMLRRLIKENDSPLPPYLKPVTALSGEHFEALTRRLTVLTHQWNRGVVRPQSIIRLDLSRSVTWLRLVSGRWLFIASSDARASSFACWDIETVFREVKEPAAECFFSGPVDDGMFEVQHEGIVIALSVGSRCESCLSIGSLIAHNNINGQFSRN